MNSDGVARRWHIALGVLFGMTGAMKLLVPALGTAFAGQLAQAELPFLQLSRWGVPVLEMAIGLALLAGWYTRLATLLVIPIMLVATYVHLVVDDPSLFPLQPEAPAIPLTVLLVAGYLVWRDLGQTLNRKSKS